MTYLVKLSFLKPISLYNLYTEAGKAADIVAIATFSADKALN